MLRIYAVLTCHILPNNYVAFSNENKMPWP